MNDMPALFPLDAYNLELESNVHPKDWVNPKPDGRYNLVVIGAGTAGLVTAAGGAGMGAKVALVERALMGGDCLNVGCVPSKAIISAARMAAAMRRSHEFGVRSFGRVDVDFAAVMERMRRLRAGISPHDSAARFRDLGVDVFLGQAQFTAGDTVKVDGLELKFAKAVIATGARAAELPIPGLRESNPLTNETVFSLTGLPARLAVIGGGPIGCELSQAFARFGSKVTQIEQHRHILAKEDSDAAERVQQALMADGVDLRLHAKTIQVETSGSTKLLQVSSADSLEKIEVDEILVGVGRQPNVEGLGLEQAAIEYDQRQGVLVNDYLQTSNPRVYAAGDVCSKFKFTHAADFMARLVIRNALFMGRSRVSQLIIPWCTYTSPELAHVGLHIWEAEEQNLSFDTYHQELRDIDRAVLDGEDAGFVRVMTNKGGSKILGATVVATHAGDLISEICLAMTNQISLARIANSIHPYPTQSEAIRRLGDQYNKTRLTPLVRNLFGSWLRWSR